MIGIEINAHIDHSIPIELMIEYTSAAFIHAVPHCRPALVHCAFVVVMVPRAEACPAPHSRIRAGGCSLWPAIDVHLLAHLHRGLICARTTGRRPEPDSYQTPPPLEFEENHGRNVLRAKYEVDTNMAALGGPGSPATGQHEVTDRIGAAARL